MARGERQGTTRGDGLGGPASARRSFGRARKVLADPERLGRLLRDASATVERADLGPLDEVADEVKRFVRLVRAYAAGEYREVPTSKILLVIGTLAYVVSPLDLVPDVLGPIGFGDDAALVAYTLGQMQEQLDAFAAWEAAHGRDPDDRDRAGRRDGEVIDLT